MNVALKFACLLNFDQLCILFSDTLKVHTHIDQPLPIHNPVLTTGTFDGVHQGHKKILQELIRSAKEYGGESVLFTFFPHPRMVLFPEDNDLKLINTQQEKIALLEEIGLDHLIVYPFSKEFSRLSALEYVRDILVNLIGVQKVVVGYDHHFGKNREGDFNQLQEYGNLYEFEVEEIPAHDIENVNISSTKIRKALVEGDISTANEYLGYPFSLSGIVIKGKGLGRELGFPTANIEVPDSYKIIPGQGVYGVNVGYKNETYRGMLNIGQNPTVNGSGGKQHIEVNIFDFHLDIYNEILKIEFIDRIRDERKFENTEELKEQLELDKIQALNMG